MKIRHATIQDFDRIMEMMIDFANSSPYNAHHNPQYNDTYVRRLLCQFMTSGCILLAEEKENTIGMLIAGIAPDPWLPEVKTLREVAWWVDEEYRLTTAGYKLLLKYIELGNKLQDEELICGFTLTNMEQSPDFNLEKRGWRPIEKNYIYEG
jgi:N-acetylglutamate synthase-like GNAT family acetyltransferase|tara:strand:- start:206 stop:661 length:456 start_codon:yes stop_codon:yes gene_type:complete